MCVIVPDICGLQSLPKVCFPNSSMGHPHEQSCGEPPDHRQREMCKSMLIRVQETELVAAGFPCIDVSRAGLKRGMGGTTTSLVKHVFRLLERALKDCRGVPWVLLENVSILVNSGLLCTPSRALI